MTIRKIISLTLIFSSIVIMLHSIIAIYLGQCMKSTVEIPSIFTQGMVDFFQLETSVLGKSLRFLSILILPSLGIEIYKNKEHRFLTGPLLLSAAGIIIAVLIICYILFYPFFEKQL